MKRRTFLVATILLAAAACAAQQEILCQGEYPWHPQGCCTDGRSIWWSFTTVLVKTDMSGSVQMRSRDFRELCPGVAKHALPHAGDICVHDGAVYAGMNLGERDGVRVGDEVWRFDADTLKVARRYPTPEAVWCNNGLEWCDGYFWVISNAPRGSKYNYVFQYTEDFRFCRPRILASGWTNLGVQTICFGKGRLWFGGYGGSAKKALTELGVEEDIACSAPTFSVDPKDLRWPTKPVAAEDRPGLVPCSRPVAEDTSCGMFEWQGKMWRMEGVRLSKPNERQRWTGRMVPCRRF